MKNWISRKISTYHRKLDKVTASPNSLQRLPDRLQNLHRELEKERFSDRRDKMITSLRGKRDDIRSFWKGHVDKHWPNHPEDVKNAYANHYAEKDQEYRTLGNHLRNLIRGNFYLGANSNKRDRKSTLRLKSQHAEIDRLMKSTRAPKIGNVDTNSDKPYGSSGMFDDKEISPYDHADSRHRNWPNMKKESLDQYIEDLIGEGFSDTEIAHMIQVEGKNEDLKREVEALKQGRKEGREEGASKDVKKAVKKGEKLGFRLRKEETEVVMEQKAAPKKAPNKRSGKISAAALKSMSPAQRAAAIKKAKAEVKDKLEGKKKPQTMSPAQRAAAIKKAKTASKSKADGEEVEKKPLDVLNANKLARSLVAATPHHIKTMMQDYLVKNNDHPAVQDHLKTTKGRQAIMQAVLDAHTKAAQKFKIPSISATKNKD